MKDQFVSYEIALKLKELGFNEPCFGYFITPIWKNGNKVLFRNSFKSPIIESHKTLPNQECLAPLWQQVFNWLWKEHKILIYPYLVPDKTLTIMWATMSIQTDFWAIKEQAVLEALKLIS